MSTTTAANIASGTPGISIAANWIFAGDYIWHRGAYRLVTSNTFAGTIRMGRFSLSYKCGDTCEVAA